MAMSVGGGGEGAPMCDINTTPLIDVMLVLLVTLIVTLPIMTHAVKLDMPPPNPNQPPPPVQPVIINLDIYYDGTIAWNGQTIPTLTDLEEQFKDAAARRIRSGSSPNDRSGGPGVRSTFSLSASRPPNGS